MARALNFRDGLTMSLDEQGTRLIELCRNAIERDPAVLLMIDEMEKTERDDGLRVVVEIEACVKVIEAEDDDEPRQNKPREYPMTARDMDFLKAMRIESV